MPDLGWCHRKHNLFIFNFVANKNPDIKINAKKADSQDNKCFFSVKMRKIQQLAHRKIRCFIS